MTKIDIFSGFLGAGKTTLIKKLIEEAYAGEKLILIENEFGEIGIDGGFLAESGVVINEMNSGCICCSLVGDFSEALQKVINEYAPDRVLIEPSGVGKLSDVIKAVQSAGTQGAQLNGFTTVVDANKCKMYMKNFGEFFNDQVEHAGCIVFSHTDNASEKKIAEAVALVRENNAHAVIVTTPWGQLTGAQLLEAMERKDTLDAELEKLKHEHHHHEHEHHHEHDECCHHVHEHHHEHDECCHHEHEHHHEHGECCHHEHEHHHHEHDECCHHEHEHHHEHGECCHHEHEHHHEHHYDEYGNCSCGHHHHHADEVFESWGAETTKKFSIDELEHILSELDNEEKYGIILRAKGIVASTYGKWINFDFIPGEPNVRYGAASVMGRLCVIGSKINKDAIISLFI